MLDQQRRTTTPGDVSFSRTRTTTRQTKRLSRRCACACVGGPHLMERVRGAERHALSHAGMRAHGVLDLKRGQRLAASVDHFLIRPLPQPPAPPPPPLCMPSERIRVHVCVVVTGVTAAHAADKSLVAHIHVACTSCVGIARAATSTNLAAKSTASRNYTTLHVIAAARAANGSYCARTRAVSVEMDGGVAHSTIAVAAEDGAALIVVSIHTMDQSTKS